jgi:hypothetical protein
MEQLEYIAVTHLDLHVPTRRDVLIFDRLAVGGVGSERARIVLPGPAIADMTLLREAGVVFDSGVKFCHLCTEWRPLAALSLGGTVSGWALREPDVWIRNELTESRDPNDRVAGLLEYLNAKGISVADVVGHAQQFLLASEHFCPGDIPAAIRTIDVITSQITVRLRAHDLGHAGHAALPLLPDVFTILQWVQKDQSASSNKQDNQGRVLSIVLNQFPELDDSVPWQEVLDLKAKLHEQQHDLHRWMRKIAKGDVGLIELRDEIEGLLADYIRHMDLQRAKRRMSRLETILLVTAEVAENLIRANFGKLAQGLVEFRNRDLGLAEAELQAPGRELAYIAAVRERFGRR